MLGEELSSLGQRKCRGDAGQDLWARACLWLVVKMVPYTYSFRIRQPYPLVSKRDCLGHQANTRLLQPLTIRRNETIHILESYVTVSRPYRSSLANEKHAVSPPSEACTVSKHGLPTHKFRTSATLCMPMRLRFGAIAWTRIVAMDE